MTVEEESDKVISYWIGKASLALESAKSELDSGSLRVRDFVEHSSTL